MLFIRACFSIKKPLLEKRALFFGALTLRGSRSKSALRTGAGYGHVVHVLANNDRGIRRVSIELEIPFRSGWVSCADGASNSTTQIVLES